MYTSSVLCATVKYMMTCLLENTHSDNHYQGSRSKVTICRCPQSAAKCNGVSPWGRVSISPDYRNPPKKMPKSGTPGNMSVKYIIEPPGFTFFRICFGMVILYVVMLRDVYLPTLRIFRLTSY